MKIAHDKHKRVASVKRRFHSVLIKVQVKTRQGWKSAVVIADTGAGPTIFRLADVDSATAEFGMEKPTSGLITADGTALAGLCGQAAITIRFEDSEYEHHVTTQIIKSNITPIIGMDFWKPHHAVFDMKQNVITIETTEEDGSTIVENIPC